MASPIKSLFSDFKSIPGSSGFSGYCYPLEIIGSDTFKDRPLIYFSRAAGKKTGTIHGSAAVVAFPIPGSLAFSDTASWDGNLDGILSTTIAGMGQETIEKLGSADNEKIATGLINQIKNKATGVSGKDLLMAGASMVPAKGPIQSIMNATSRSIPNPNVISQFSGSGQRSFSFKFSMVASSAKESEAIRNIVDLFKISVYPEGNALRLSYPPEWNISFMKGGSEMKTLPQIANVVLTQVDTNYNSQAGYSFHTDGSPIDVELTLGFKETRVLTANDIKALKDNGALALRYKTKNAFQSAAEVAASLSQ